MVFATIAGAVMTVGIAWAAMFVPHGTHGYGPPTVDELGVLADDSGEYRRYLQVWEGRNRWHRVISFWWMQMSGRSMMIRLDDYEARRVDLEDLPRHLRPESAGDVVMLSWYREVGWPMKALTCSVHWERQIRNEDILYRVEGGYQLPRDDEFQPRALPLVPLPVGFAVNVIFWGFIVMALSWIPGATRRTMRRRGGRCEHCGYPREGLPPGSVCPECGR